MFIPYNYYKISNKLLEFHEIFYKFWTIGRPTFVESIQTAAIAFNKKNGKYLQFLFNPKFWNYLDDYERCFIIAHECLHVILNHGRRGRGKDQRKTNIALDLIVNNMLTNNIGLKLTPKLLEGIHFQTVFKDPNIVPKNKSFEFYYNYLTEHPENISDKINISDHDYLYEINIEDLIDYISENQNLSEKQKKELKEKLNNELKDKVGTESLDKILDIYNEPKIKFKFKWETIIKKIVQNKYSSVFREYESPNWVKEDRRTTLMSKDVILPLYLDEKPEYKYELWFFSDVSGSCEHYASKFLSVAQSIPDKIFDVKFHTFDVSTREVNLKNPKIVGGGGTCFSQIETYIQNKIKKDRIKYPETIVCISDGQGTIIKPQYPQNWLWILTSNNRNCLPENTKVVMLDEL